MNVLSDSGLIVPDNNVQQFERLMLNGVIYYGESRAKMGKRNNRACCFQSPEGLLHYGNIISFNLSKHTEPFSIIQSYNSPQQTPLSTLRRARHEKIHVLNPDYHLRHRMVKIDPHHHDIVAVPVACIQRKCCSVPINRDIQYIVPLPNSYEVH